MNEPRVPQTDPYVMDMKPGKYAWCACGESKNQPFCDGSHKGTGFTPVVVEIKENQPVAWCGCKHSEGKPYCDGTHASL